MALNITLENLQSKIPLNRRQILRVAKAVLTHEGVLEAQLSIVFVTDQRITTLNKKFLHRSHPTDVLAFDLGSELSKKKIISGEIIISTETAIRQAKEFQSTPSREIILYLVHGILHLLGFDDHRPGDIKRIRKKESELMEFLE